MYAKMYAHKKIAPGALTPRATKTLILFYFIMAGVEGLEPQPPVLETGALPIELHSYLIVIQR